MSYTNNVPQANQQIFSTQPLIAANFTYLETAIGTEHNFTVTNATRTYHKQMSLPNKALAETANPTPVTGANGILYAQASGPGTTTVSGLRYYTTTGNQIFRLTDCFVGTTGFQWIGAVMIQWGFVSTPSNPQTVTFTTPFPNNVFSVQVSIQSSGASSETLTIAGAIPASFSVRSSKTSASSFYWMAIGN